MSELKIHVNQNSDIEWLIAAAEDVTNATEVDFEAMKAKAWYKRLWETITFSKNNEILLANGVTSLAKLQDLVIRTLLVVSKDNAIISNQVKEISSRILQLSVVDSMLLREISRIRYGKKDVVAFRELDGEKKSIIAVLVSMADPNATPTTLSKQYMSSLLRIAGQATLVDVAYENIEKLSSSEQELLYQMIIVRRYLTNMAFDADSDVIDELSISKNRQKEICDEIRKTAENVTPEFFAAFYEDEIAVPDFIDKTDIVFCQDDIENAPEEDLYDVEEYMDEATETCNPAEEKEDNVRKCIEQLSEDKTTFWVPVHRYSLGEQKKILSQMAFAGQESADSIVGVYDIAPFHAVNGGYSGILFLTNGFYFKKNDRTESEYMAYSEIWRVEEKFMTLIIHGKKGTVIRLKSASYVQSPLAKVFRELRDIYQ